MTSGKEDKTVWIVFVRVLANRRAAQGAMKKINQIGRSCFSSNDSVCEMLWSRIPGMCG